MNGYMEQKQKIAKMEMSIAFVTLVPNLIEKAGFFKFKDGAAVFSTKILEDENSMFRIADLMPTCQGGDYYVKYLSAGIFLGSLCYHNIVFGGRDDGRNQYKNDRTKSEPKDERTEQKEEIHCSSR